MELFELLAFPSEERDCVGRRVSIFESRYDLRDVPTLERLVFETAASDRDERNTLLFLESDFIPNNFTVFTIEFGSPHVTLFKVLVACDPILIAEVKLHFLVPLDIPDFKQHL